MDNDLDFSASHIVWSDRIEVDGRSHSCADIIARLGPLLTDERRSRLDQVVAGRSLRLVPVLENIYDRGNVSAVMRSAEAFGFLRMFLVDPPGARFKAANRVTRGAEKWLDVVRHHDPAAAVADLRAQGYAVWATDLGATRSIDELDFNRPLAFVFGNEKDGVSAAMLDQVDGRFRIPMAGFSQSFNISVAAALCFYRAGLEFRARLGDGAGLDDARRSQVLANYYLRCFDNPARLLAER